MMNLALTLTLVLTQTYPIVSNGTITTNGSKPQTGLSSGELDLILDVTGAVDGGSPALSVTVQESDPQAPLIVLDGGISFSIGPVTSSVPLGPTHAKLFNSSAVLVSWTVDGGSYFSGVNISLINRSTISAPSVEGIDGGRPISVLPPAIQAVYVVGNDGGNVAVSNLPSILPDGGAVSAYQGGNWSVQATIDGGVAVTGLPSILPDGGTVGAGQVGSWYLQGAFLDGGWLSYSTTTPLAVDPSEQTSGLTGVTLCGLGPGTAVGLVANAKSQMLYNNGPNIVCIGYSAAISCPPAIDAGTTIGFPLPPGGIFSESGGVQLYCDTATTAQLGADAGTNWLDTK